MISLLCGVDSEHHPDMSAILNTSTISWILIKYYISIIVGLLTEFKINVFFFLFY